MGYTDKEKQRAYQRAWMKKRREDWLIENGPCVLCGSDDDLQVDHVDRQTKITHRVWSLNKERRLRELSKCQVLCQPCHSKKTTADFGWGKHGSRSRYRQGCRCDLCMDARRKGYKGYATYKARE